MGLEALRGLEGVVEGHERGRAAAEPFQRGAALADLDRPEEEAGAAIIIADIALDALSGRARLGRRGPSSPSVEIADGDARLRSADLLAET